MNPTQYHLKKWQARSEHSKILIMISLCSLAAIVAVVLWQLVYSNIPWGIHPWLKIGVLIIANLIFLTATLSSFSQYCFLYQYHLSEWILKQSPQELELVTGTILHSQAHYVPYAGHFRRISLKQLDGRTRIYYMKRERNAILESNSQVRLLTHHIFAVESYEHSLYTAG